MKYPKTLTKLPDTEIGPIDTLSLNISEKPIVPHKKKQKRSTILAVLCEEFIPTMINIDKNDMDVIKPKTKPNETFLR